MLKPTASDLKALEAIKATLLAYKDETIDFYDIEDEQNVFFDDTEEYTVTHGVTRVCFIPRIVGNVIFKINVDSYNESKTPDLCAREVHYYNVAKNWKIEQYFAEIHGIKKLVGRFHIYMQERVPHAGYTYSDLCSEANKTFRDLDHRGWEIYEEYHCDMSSLGAGFFEAKIGFDKASELFHFLGTFRDDINDVHTGNIGTREDGTPVIFDYGGVRGVDL